MQVLRLTMVGLLAAMLLAPSALAERTKPNIHFFSGPESDAHWTPQDSSDDDKNGMSIELDVGPLTSFGFAGLEFNHEEGQPLPTREPYFFHKEDRESPVSGGSPRLVVFLSDGGNIQLRPDEWTTDWRKVGEGEEGEQGNWDSNGGSCTFQYDETYENVVACHPDALVTNVQLVTDSNWMADKASGYINWVDQIQYNDFVYSHASDNNNSQAG